MARQRVRKDASSPEISLALPDRSGPNPSKATLLELAAQRGLLNNQNEHTADEDDTEAVEELDPPIGRLGESIMWSLSLAMLHFTLDVLVQHQYAVKIIWRNIVNRSMQAFGVILVLFYIFHPHSTPSSVLPRIPTKYQNPLRQLLFFLTSISTGCYLVYITNEHGYFAVMKQAPPLGVVWIWSVIELDVKWATCSLLCCFAFLKLGGYSIT